MQDGAMQMHDTVDYRALDGVRTRRIIAFAIDFAMICILVTVGGFLVALVGILTFGLGFLLYAILVPAVALIYCGSTIGAPEAATIGMRMTGLKLTLKNGEKPTFIIGAIHAVLYYASTAILTPFVLLFSLINVEKRLLHDLILGSVVVRAD